MRNDILFKENSYELQEDPATFDFVEGTSDDQHVESMVMFNKGDNRDFPTAGFEVRKRLKQRTDKNKFLRQLEVELDTDNYSNADITVSDDLKILKIDV